MHRSVLGFAATAERAAIPCATDAKGAAVVPTGGRSGFTCAMATEGALARARLHDPKA